MKIKKICMATLMALSIITLASCGKDKTTNKNTSKNNTTITTKNGTTKNNATTAKKTTKKATTKDNAVYEGDLKFVPTKDSKGNDTLVYCYYKDSSNNYVPYGKVEREYDSSNRVVSSYSFEYDNKKKDYVGLSGFSYVYDDKGRIQQETEVRHDLKLDRFYIAFWYVYEFDDSNRITKTTVQRSDSPEEGLANWAIFTTTYDGNTKTTIRAYYSTSSKTYRDTFEEVAIYDSKNRLIREETKQFSGTEKVNYSLVENTYDDAEKTYTNIRYTTDNDKNYVPRQKLVLTGDEDIPERILEYSYDDEKEEFYLVKQQLTECFDGGKIKYITQEWDESTSTWTNAVKAEYIMDKYNIYAYRNVLYWNGTDWVDNSELIK